MQCEDFGRCVMGGHAQGLTGECPGRARASEERTSVLWQGLALPQKGGGEALLGRYVRPAAPRAAPACRPSCRCGPRGASPPARPGAASTRAASRPSEEEKA
ncbi:unnamed protein product [Prorocentrum cordatum]|uniref:Uncharacterized protein n=1 Tax=Prorocentrum cordatum TaxID=2364126 RepID=A0ABN9QEA9_9DINO|nr:unnamed protein product [Polarella glacialis]